MIIVDRNHLKFLLSGRTIRVKVPREYRKGRSYNAGTNTKKAVVRVEIIDIYRDTGHWELLIRQSAEEVVYYLSANPAGSRADYTTNPARAARNPDGVALQADAQDTGDRIVAAQWLQKIANEASERDDQRRREQAHQARIAAKRERNSVTRRLL